METLKEPKEFKILPPLIRKAGAHEKLFKGWMIVYGRVSSDGLCLTVDDFGTHDEALWFLREYYPRLSSAQNFRLNLLNAMKPER